MKPVIIIGAGAHVTVVIDVLRLMKREIGAICDPKLNDVNTYQGIPVVLETELNVLLQDKFELVNGIASVKSLVLRKKIFTFYKNLGYIFASIIHPSAIVSDSAQFEEGVQIMAGAIVQPRAFIGCNSIINTRAIVEHDSHIGSSVHIAPGAVICGGVRVGEETHIGAGAVVIQNISIGSNTIVGANTTVLSNIIDNQRVITRQSVIQECLSGEV